jgi:hypothetical protein
VRVGVCQRGAAKRPQARPPGPIWADTLANSMVQCNWRALDALCNGVIRAVAKAGVFGKRVTGMADGTDLETTERYTDGGRAARKRHIKDKWGKVHEIAVTVYGGKVLLVIDAVPKMPLAVKVGQIQEHEALWTRALVAQAQANLAGYARLHTVVFDRAFLAGTDLWWLEQHGLLFVVPATDNMGGTADARALAAAGEGVTVGRRVHTVRHGQGRGAWSERWETAVVGSTGLTTDEPYGTEAHGRHHHRRDFEPNPINAVVVRKWKGQDYGPAGKTVFLTNAPVDKPLRPFDDYDDRSLIENCCIKEAKPQWDLGHPPQKTARAVRVHVVCTLLMCALATAYRLRCEQAALGPEPVGWQRWRRQLLEQTRDQVIVFARGYYGIFHITEFALLVGVKLTDMPPGIGTLPDVLAKFGLPAHG